MQYGDPIWEQVISTQGWGKYPVEEVIRFFMKSKKILGKENPTVLDIGSGIGANSWFMAKEGGKVTAFDGAPTALKQTNDIAKRFGVLNNIETVFGDITKPKEYIHGHFDLMLDNYSLCANSNDQIIKALQDYLELLNEGGFLLMNCFGKKTTGYGTGTKVSENEYKDLTQGALHNRGLICFYDRNELNKIFTDIGFKIQYIENLLDDRNGIIVEKHITCMAK